MNNQLTAIIVDDMPLAIASLQAELEDHCPNVTVTHTANGVLDAARILKTEKPDILFLDIQMNDGDGFDLLDIIDHSWIKVIFTTGSKEYAIKAFQYTALDYLLKPIDPNRLKEAVEKAEQSDSQPQEMNKLQEDRSTNRKTIILHTQEEVRIVKIDQIVRCESSNNYTIFYFSDGTKLLVSKTLKEYEKMLPDSFLRVHQSHLVHIPFIKSFVKNEGGYILLHNKQHVPVSVRKRTELMEALDNLN